MRQLGLILLFWLTSTASHADILILIHGYLGEAKSWQDSGVTTVLQKNGWQHSTTGQQRFRIINLPSEAPISVQSAFLTQALKQTRKAAPNERIILVGHSAGGIVARLTMVQNPDLNIFALLTIASPHLGASLANKALFLSKTPLSMMAPFVGANTINRSSQLYADLSTAKPGTLLGWLNQQKHPKAHYISLLRSDRSGNSEDNIVPLYSQDMRNVSALRQQAVSYRLNNGHTLSKTDGLAIVGILSQVLRL